MDRADVGCNTFHAARPTLRVGFDPSTSSG
jgi:hypothetical protein